MPAKAPWQPPIHMTTEAFVLLLIFCLVASLASLLGGWFPAAFRLTHTRLQTALSFIGGLMLGMALLNFLPHAAEELHSMGRAGGGMLGGFLVMFLLQRVFHYHHHEPGEDGGAGQHAEPGHRGEACAQDGARAKGTRPWAWVAVACGLGVHSVVDGMALAAAVMTDAVNQTLTVSVGAAVAVTLHKPFDGLTVLTLMHAQGASARLRWVVNLGIALTVPLGAMLAWLGLGEDVEANHHFLGGVLAFCAGSFLCVACSDLLPELQFHKHDRLRLTVAVLAGVLVAMMIALWGEPESHSHDSHGHHPRATLGGSKVGPTNAAADLSSWES